MRSVFLVADPVRRLGIGMPSRDRKSRGLLLEQSWGFLASLSKKGHTPRKWDLGNMQMKKSQRWHEHCATTIEETFDSSAILKKEGRKTVKQYQGTTSSDPDPQGVTSAQPPEPQSQKENAKRKSEEQKRTRPDKQRLK